MSDNKKKNGGARPGAGKRIFVIPSRRRQYRIPEAFLNEATAEIKAILKKYRDKCRTL